MRLSRVNTGLLVAILLINGYVILLPVIPGIVFWVQTRDNQRLQQMENAIHEAPERSGSGPQLSQAQNRLIVPSMLLDEPIHEGQDSSTLLKGLWRRPHASAPDKKGNTVIVGHRLTYADPKGSLYHLDKVRSGDSIGVTWNNKKYLYTVIETKVVPSNETSIEAPTTRPRLTIYTCTPLWLPKDRLVVIASLEKIL
jgi:sortase A